ncbi:7558_t:CDS:2 [Racocetra fulgida]|uniref:7558_t:CDS:1 n=1 Tax=Racocetra fulgida TaxID=60492 RepID=A0A9N8WE23_9GLOM|nr:7558_t:CDS:2 [Racocetra fulgida]
MVYDIQNNHTIYVINNVINRFLYCGETILDLLVASDEFGLTKLIDHIQQYFVENQKNFLQQNPVGTLHIAARHETFNEILNNGYYPNIGIPNGKQIEDYEVFQVISRNCIVNDDIFRLYPNY